MYTNLHNCDMSLLVVAGNDNEFACPDAKTNEWKVIATTKELFGSWFQPVVSYQPEFTKHYHNVEFPFNK